MIVKSPLKKHDIRPNLRKVPKPDAQTSPGSSQKKKRKAGRESSKIGIPKVKPWKVIVGSLIISALGLMYLTHVFSTQQSLREVQQLQAEYNRARAQYDELKLEYDRMVGPAEIYRKAEAQGFVNGGPAEQVIIIER
ncbi:FtsL-like putative cell division protein [Gracilimonas mengyeensis]|uniref:Uncharacterized protein n=1 Tax=Gracilimonas mengyeensis TaxID=1302730 RepID=A0A521E191_9BACT|nr:FtsL-like putative cell division protein [Gracilimonas mengyeensis]SMO77747.1 hypothetical protein SAMN06265219_11058 [Gracilimonas mengyeensis]